MSNKLKIFLPIQAITTDNVMNEAESVESLVQMITSDEIPLDKKKLKPKKKKIILSDIPSIENLGLHDAEREKVIDIQRRHKHEMISNIINFLNEDEDDELLFTDSYENNRIRKEIIRGIIQIGGFENLQKIKLSRRLYTQNNKKVKEGEERVEPLEINSIVYDRTKFKRAKVSEKGVRGRILNPKYSENEKTELSFYEGDVLFSSTLGDSGKVKMMNSNIKSDINHEQNPLFDLMNKYFLNSEGVEGSGLMGWIDYIIKMKKKYVEKRDFSINFHSWLLKRENETEYKKHLSLDGPNYDFTVLDERKKKPTWMLFLYKMSSEGVFGIDQNGFRMYQNKMALRYVKIVEEKLKRIQGKIESGESKKKLKDERTLNYGKLVDEEAPDSEDESDAKEEKVKGRRKKKKQTKISKLVDTIDKKKTDKGKKEKETEMEMDVDYYDNERRKIFNRINIQKIEFSVLKNKKDDFIENFNKLMALHGMLTENEMVKEGQEIFRLLETINRQKISNNNLSTLVKNLRIVCTDLHQRLSILSNNVFSALNDSYKRIKKNKDKRGNMYIRTLLVNRFFLIFKYLMRISKHVHHAHKTFDKNLNTRLKTLVLEEVKKGRGYYPKIITNTIESLSLSLFYVIYRVFGSEKLLSDDLLKTPNETNRNIFLAQLEIHGEKIKGYTPYENVGACIQSLLWLLKVNKTNDQTEGIKKALVKVGTTRKNYKSWWKKKTKEEKTEDEQILADLIWKDGRNITKESEINMDLLIDIHEVKTMEMVYLLNSGTFFVFDQMMFYEFNKMFYTNFIKARLYDYDKDSLKDELVKIAGDLAEFSKYGDLIENLKLKYRGIILPHKADSFKSLINAIVFVCHKKMKSEILKEIIKTFKAPDSLQYNQLTNEQLENKKIERLLYECVFQYTLVNSLEKRKQIQILRHNIWVLNNNRKLEYLIIIIWKILQFCMKEKSAREMEKLTVDFSKEKPKKGERITRIRPGKKRIDVRKTLISIDETLSKDKLSVFDFELKKNQKIIVDIEGSGEKETRIVHLGDEIIFKLLENMIDHTFFEKELDYTLFEDTVRDKRLELITSLLYEYIN